MGFTAKLETQQDKNEQAKKRVRSEVRKLFKPEFLNRIDELLVFHPLGKDELARIVDILLKDVKQRLAEKGMKLEISPAARQSSSRTAQTSSLVRDRSSGPSKSSSRMRSLSVCCSAASSPAIRFM